MKFSKTLFPILLCLCLFMCSCSKKDEKSTNEGTSSAPSSSQSIKSHSINTSSSIDAKDTSSSDETVPQGIVYPNGKIEQKPEELKVVSEIVNNLLPTYNEAMRVSFGWGLESIDEREIIDDATYTKLEKNEKYNSVSDIINVISQVFTDEFAKEFFGVQGNTVNNFKDFEGALYVIEADVVILPFLTNEHLVIDLFETNEIHFSDVSNRMNQEKSKQSDYIFISVKIINQNGKWVVDGIKVFQLDSDGNECFTGQSIRFD